MVFADMNNQIEDGYRQKTFKKTFEYPARTMIII
jgi:hypothetical protein